MLLAIDELRQEEVNNVVHNLLSIPRPDIYANVSSSSTPSKINNALFVKVQKVFLIYRWPMSPYITEKT